MLDNEPGKQKVDAMAKIRSDLNGMMILLAVLYVVFLVYVGIYMMTGPGSSEVNAPAITADCSRAHTWTKWTKPVHYHNFDWFHSNYDRQERSCKRCNKMEESYTYCHLDSMACSHR